MEKITFDDVKNYFGGIPNLAAKLGVSPQAIYQWEGVIPGGRAYQIESVSKGALKADLIIAGNPRYPDEDIQ